MIGYSMPPEDRLAAWICTLIFLFVTIVAAAFWTVYMFGPPSVVPRCPEDATVAYNGECITVDDADFRDGYWYPKER